MKATRPKRLTLWLGHRWWPMAVLYVAPVLIPDSAFTAGGFAAVGPLRLYPVMLLYLALMVAFFFSIYASLRHDRSLCEECIAAMPLNPSERAEEKRRSLRAAHWLTGSRRRLYVMAVGIIAAVALGMAYIPSKLIPVSAVLVVSAIVTRIVDTHRALQPWCPWCHDGGRDEDEIVTPDPDPAGARR